MSKENDITRLQYMNFVYIAIEIFLKKPYFTPFHKFVKGNYTNLTCMGKRDFLLQNYKWLIIYTI